MRTGLADFHLVPDERIAQARRLLAGYAHTLAEGAGAAALAAVLERPEEFAGRTVALMCTGGNASPAELADLARTGPDLPPSRTRLSRLWTGPIDSNFVLDG
jgi:threonine dehydratase